MIIISDILNTYYKTKLKSYAYRKKVYDQAFNKELSNSKLGIVLLRNLNELMWANPNLHSEIINIIGEDNYQQNFWESDFGFLWYQGNLNTKNFYFNYALNEINKNKYQTVLDVGCGWGEFSAAVSKSEFVTNSLGVDISRKIIEEAINKHSTTKASYFCKDVLEIEGEFDLVTLFGSTDYIHPSIFNSVLDKILQIAVKRIIIVNSLRNMPLNDVKELVESKEIRRYDIGYVHPIKFILDCLSKKYNFCYTLEKAGFDSILIDIIKI